ncbi:MAG TPA: hypothetical protein VN939_16935 [Chthoniobacterales bacterium]|jgi:hypothetical protein|nr:hypothetical protein [Chthoniobacterales bacterium]
MPDLSGGTKHVPQEYFALGAVSLGVLRSTGDRQKLFASAADIDWVDAIGGEARRNVLE